MYTEYRIRYSHQNSNGIVYGRDLERLKESIQTFKVPSTYSLEGFNGSSWVQINEHDAVNKKTNTTLHR